MKASDDAFLEFARQPRPNAIPKTSGHGERAHSKFSASGAERWFACPGSVELSEGLPDKSSVWAEEGTQAHEVLEATMKIELSGNDGAIIEETQHIFHDRKTSREMVAHAEDAMKIITELHYNTPDSECGVEERIYLDFIHPEMFGTYDARVVEHFGTLHVFDYKYGAGVSVSPKENLQMIFYGIGLAAKYDWNFKRVRLWVIQPRIKGYNGPLWWDVSINELRAYVEKFRTAVKRVEKYPNRYVEGGHCHWCKAKSICPLKVEARNEAAIEIFKVKPVKRGKDGKEEKGHEEIEVESFEEKGRKGYYQSEAERIAEDFAESIRIDEEIEAQEDF